MRLDHSLRSITQAAQDAALSEGCSCGCFQPPGIAEPLQGNPLWALFQAQRKGPVIRKWSPYLNIYHRWGNSRLGICNSVATWCLHGAYHCGCCIMLAVQYLFPQHVWLLIDRRR